MVPADIKLRVQAQLPNVSKETLENFLAVCTYKKLKNREVLIEPWSKDDKAFFILSGDVRGYFFNKKGEEKNLFLRSKNTFMGPPDALFENVPTKYCFEAILETEILEFSYNRYRELAMTNPEIFQLLLMSHREIILTLVSRVESLIDETPEER